MPRPRRLARRRVANGLPPAAWRYLCDLLEEGDEADEGYIGFRFFSAPVPVEAAWRLYGAQATAEYAQRHPGRRPALWWRHSAPGAPHAERRQVGGKGKPCGGILVYGVSYFIEIDPSGLPLFESQAAYLRRLGLLLPGEARRLKPADYEPETVTVEQADG